MRVAIAPHAPLPKINRPKPMPDPSLLQGVQRGPVASQDGENLHGQEPDGGSDQQREPRLPRPVGPTTAPARVTARINNAATHTIGSHSGKRIQRPQIDPDLGAADLPKALEWPE